MDRLVDADGLIKMSEGVKVHYKGVLDNLTFLKRQQWTITNHSLVLYAAMVALAKGTNDIERTLLTVFAFLGCGYAIYCMWHTQRSMTRYYRNLYDIQQNYFHAPEREVLQMLPSRPDFHYNGAFIYGLMFANVAAFLVSAYYIWIKGGLPILDSRPPGAKSASSGVLFEHALALLA